MHLLRRRCRHEELAEKQNASMPTQNALQTHPVLPGSWQASI
jgi:hypothetical protein